MQLYNTTDKKQFIYIYTHVVINDFYILYNTEMYAFFRLTNMIGFFNSIKIVYQVLLTAANLCYTNAVNYINLLGLNLKSARHLKGCI